MQLKGYCFVIFCGIADVCSANHVAQILMAKIFLHMQLTMEILMLYIYMYLFHSGHTE